MRILIVSNLYPPNVIGGYERQCFEVTEALAAQGHEMTVLTSRFGGRVADYPPQAIRRELDLLTGSTIYTPFPGGPQDRARLNAANLQTLQRVLEEVQPDVVYAWNLFFLDASILSCLEQSRFRTVVMLSDNWLLVMRNPDFVAAFFRDYVHGPSVFMPPSAANTDQPAPRTLLRRIKESLPWRTPGAAAAPIGESRLDATFGARFVYDFYTAGGIRFRRSRIVHNGVKQTTYASASRDRSHLASPGVLRLLFCGRLVDLKGVHTAVAALDLLDAAAIGVDRIALAIVGDAQDAVYMDALNASIRDSPNAAAITVQPAVAESELSDLFRAHDIYLFPSLYEPFSLTLIQALACGIPTIASATGGNPEIVEDGVSGLLFPKGDPAGLAAAIARLARDPELRVRLAKAGQQAASGFTFERMVREMAEFLEPP